MYQLLIARVPFPDLVLGNKMAALFDTRRHARDGEIGRTRMEVEDDDPESRPPGGTQHLEFGRMRKHGFGNEAAARSQTVIAARRRDVRRLIGRLDGSVLQFIALNDVGIDEGRLNARL